ncbi:hypothetical protein N9U74_02770 [Synechococcus sp. AH-736-M02]|nr:hypothetical protein [Synechococcus sp. AH-736-M02]
MISPKLQLLSASLAETMASIIDDGCFPSVAPDLIPLQMTLIHILQRDVISNYLLNVEPDWPWAKQPMRQ